jgi:hypothetical protein
MRVDLDAHKAKLSREISAAAEELKNREVGAKIDP